MKRTCTFVSLFFVLAMGLPLANATESGCSQDVLEIVGRHLKLPDLAPKDQESRLAAESCKRWPYKENILLSVFAYTAEPLGKKEAEAEYEKQLVVAMIEETSRRVLSSHQGVILEDAITQIGANSLQLDTARYQLASNVRAFGLRFNSTAIGPSCGEARWNDELTLFVPEGKRLRPVLNMYMNRQRSLEGCLSVFARGAVWETAELTVSMAATRTNGYADVLVRAKVSTDSNDEEAEKAKAARVESHLLRYDGRGYTPGPSAPWWLSN